MTRLRNQFSGAPHGEYKILFWKDRVLLTVSTSSQDQRQQDPMTHPESHRDTGCK